MAWWSGLLKHVTLHAICWRMHLYGHPHLPYNSDHACMHACNCELSELNMWQSASLTILQKKEKIEVLKKTRALVVSNDYYYS